VANALTYCVRRADFPGVARVLALPGGRNERRMLVLALGRVKTAESVQFLLRTLADEDLTWSAIKALGQIGAIAMPALSQITVWAEHSDREIRKVAKSAIARITRA
jgi:HEAT repeat protein